MLTEARDVSGQVATAKAWTSRPSTIRLRHHMASASTTTSLRCTPGASVSVKSARPQAKAGSVAVRHSIKPQTPRGAPPRAAPLPPIADTVCAG